MRIISGKYANYVDVQQSINWLSAVLKVTNLLDGVGTWKRKVYHQYNMQTLRACRGLLVRNEVQNGVIDCCNNLR